MVLVALVKPLGDYMARVYEGERTFFEKVLRTDSSGSSTASRRTGRDEEREMRGQTYALAMLLFNAAGLVVVYALQRLQAVLAAEPAGLAGRVAGPLVEHGDELRDEHELARLRRRDDDELPHADARPRGAELRLRGVGHGVLVALIRGVHAQAGDAASATSGSI